MGQKGSSERIEPFSNIRNLESPCFCFKTFH